jgi:predicted transposase/invertase (TIGR01784 family)
MSRYIDPFTDFGFKKLLGTEGFSEPILQSILNSTLDLPSPIKKLSFKNPFKLPDSSIEKGSIFDLYCIDENNSHIIVEMQRAKVEFFKERLVYYSTFPIRDQLTKGSPYNLSAVYCVVIVDFKLFEKPVEIELLHDIALRYPNGDSFYNKLQYRILEMPEFNKTYEEVTQSQNVSDMWLYTLKHMTEWAEPPKQFQNNLITEMLHQAEEINLTPEARALYRESFKVAKDNIALITGARKDGVEEGKEIGLVEGEQIGLAKGKEIGFVEGEQIGLAKGEQIGIIKMIKKSLPRLLKDGLSLAEIAVELDVSLELVKQAQEDL